MDRFGKKTLKNLFKRKPSVTKSPVRPNSPIRTLPRNQSHQTLWPRLSNLEEFPVLRQHTNTLDVVDGEFQSRYSQPYEYLRHVTRPDEGPQAEAQSCEIPQSDTLQCGYQPRGSQLDQAQQYADQPSTAPTTVHASSDDADWNLVPALLNLRKRQPKIIQEALSRDPSPIIEPPFARLPTRTAASFESQPVALDRHRSLKRPLASPEDPWRHRIGGPRANSLDFDQENEFRTPFSASFAQMAVFEDDLRSTIDASHAELGKRASQTYGNSKALAVSAHLMRTPPRSPASVRGSSGSPGYQRLKSLTEMLEKEDSEELVKRDEEFHLLMDTFEGIKEWWYANSLEWAKKKQEVADHDRYISEYAEQRDDHYHAFKRLKTSKGRDSEACYENSQVAHFQEQVEVLEIEQNLIKTWFVHNRELMKQAWERFKNMREESELLEEEARVQRPIPRPIHKFEFVWCGGHYMEIADLTFSHQKPMIRDKGLIWFFNSAVQDLRDVPTFLHQEKMKWTERKEKGMRQEAQHREKAHKNLAAYRQSEAHYDKTIQSLRTRLLAEGHGATETEEIRAILIERNQKRKAFEDAHELFNKIIFSFVIQDNLNGYKQNELTERLWRADACLRLLASAADQLVRNKDRHAREPNYYPNPTQIQDIINICYWESQRQYWVKILESLTSVDQVVAKPYTTKRILHEAKIHLESKGIFEKGQNTLKMTLPASLEGRSTTWSPMCELFQTEYLPFLSMVKRLEVIAKEPELIPLDADTVSWKPPQLPSVLEFPSWAWPPRVSITESFEWMHKRRTPESNPYGYKIFRFFNSPDIAPLFWGQTKAKYTKDEFIRVIHSLVTDSDFGDERHWLEFLKVCNFTGEMFTVSRLFGDIYVSPQGWDIWPEAHVSNSYQRKVRYEAPRGIEKLERTLLRHKKEFMLDSSDRRWRKEDLLQVINKFKVDGDLDKKKLNKYLGYWSGKGKFFVNTYLTSQAEMVHRIDNGWEISHKLPYVPPRTEPPHFAAIAQRVERETDIRPACMRHPDKSGDLIFTTENELYNLSYKTKTWESSKECSRYDFHMYLRWCDKTGVPFECYRNTDVLVTGRLWGDMGRDVVTRIERGDFHDFIWQHRRRRREAL